ncbi:MAG: SagB/ThcOx family dehydrogenase [Chloroflexi bacterium]|nr:SagB/ThcOx family dehydrogenase [Chloroflexota bacterium]
MNNQNSELARNYHESTKLTYINLRNKPPLYKSYTGLPVVELPNDSLGLESSALSAVAGPAGESDQPFDLNTLANLLYFSAGVIRKATLRNVGEVHYRAAASAGALYPIETYVVCPDMPGLEAGVYHFSPASFSLHQIRSGDFRRHLSEAAGNDETVANSAATIVYSSVFWRSSWKYRSRGYRYCFWDNGTMVANLMASASATGLTSKLLLGFVDSQVDQLIGVDGNHEASICLVSVGRDESNLDSPTPIALDEICGRSVSAYPDEVDYPDIRQTHAATRLISQEAVNAWRGSVDPASSTNRDGLYPLEHPDPQELDAKSLGQVVGDRGSTRRYARESIDFAKFSALLSHSARGIPADFLEGEWSSLLDIYLMVNAVEGIPSGAYFFSPAQQGLELLHEGNLREEAGHLCFEQALGADASVVAFIMADLSHILERFGNRGYRAAQLEAGVVGGKIYLAAYSLGLGASGITFYDDEVVDLFLPHSAGKDVMFVVTLGKTAQENRVRPFRSKVAVRLDALARGAGQG